MNCAMRDAWQEDKENQRAKELAELLFDTATLRSGFYLKDSTEFAERVERMLRTSYGVSPDAKVRLRLLLLHPPYFECSHTHCFVRARARDHSIRVQVKYLWRRSVQSGTCRRRRKESMLEEGSPNAEVRLWVSTQ